MPFRGPITIYRLCGGGRRGERWEVRGERWEVIGSQFSTFPFKFGWRWLIPPSLPPSVLPEIYVIPPNKNSSGLPPPPQPFQVTGPLEVVIRASLVIGLTFCRLRIVQMFLEKLFTCGWHLLLVKAVHSPHVKITFPRWAEPLISFLMRFVSFTEIAKRYGDIYGG